MPARGGEPASGSGRRVLHIVQFLYVFLTVGFVLGTLVLLGPVRWLSDAARAAEWSEGAESALVIVVILAYVAIAFVVARWLARGLGDSDGRPPAWRRASPAWTTVLALGTLSLWLQPDLINAAGRGEAPAAVTSGGARFVFGPYPEQDELARLRREGYTAVISLLHPGVVPFEPKLLYDEAAAARKVGIPLISLPMLPWIGNNTTSIDSLRTIARSGKGRYYVHCYLGRDRVNVARRAITSVSSALVEGSAHAAQDIRQKASFERGRIFVLEDSVFLTPYPTDEEFLAYVVAGGVQTVVSLLDPAVEPNRTWIQREKQLLANAGVRYVSLPISVEAYAPDEVLRIAREVRSLPQPLVVHAFLSTSPEAAAFRDAYVADVPPLLLSGPAQSLTGGVPAMIAPNLLAGPRPSGREFGAVLRRAGVRRVLYIGDRSELVLRDSVIAANAGLVFTVLPALVDGPSKEQLKVGGPWYIYGPGADTLRQAGPRGFTSSVEPDDHRGSIRDSVLS